MMTKGEMLRAFQGSAILALLALPLWPFVLAYVAIKLVSGGPFDWKKELHCQAQYAAIFWVLLAISFLLVLVSRG